MSTLTECGDLAQARPADASPSAQQREPSISPFLVELVRNALDTIADELALIIMRTAYSSIVRDAMDYSTAVCDAAGATLAQGLTTPLHLGSFFDAMKNLIAEYDGRIFEGDVFIFNDPYLAAGQHLPDVYVVRPVFVDGVLEAWSTTVAHQNDIGGMVPGSNSIGSTEIYQEGLRLPVLKLVERGVEQTAIWQILAANVRVPDKVIGDIRAQVAACFVGEKELSALFRKHGVPTLRRVFAEIHDYAERLTRAEFAEIPDGVYAFENHIDGIGPEPEPIRFRVTLTIDGDRAIVDFTGTSAQVKGGINSPIPFSKAAAYTALRSVLKSEIPNAQGFTRAITFIAPPGTIANPLPPAACGARGITGFRMIDCLMGALAQAVPERVPADGNGGATLPSIGGMHNGKPFVFVETMMGTTGGTPGHDGLEGVAHLGANQSNIPIEMIEAEHPLRVERYALVPDSGGAGKYRGGLSMVRDFRLLSDEATLTVRSDKRRFPPYGLHGGRPGAPSFNIVNPDGDAKVLPTLFKDVFTLRRGDVFRHVLAGGGGYGPPLERDPALVLKDVRQERVTLAHARDAYGVAIFGSGDDGDLRVDAAATAALRDRMRRG
jgi:N-methylhydantoinase B